MSHWQPGGCRSTQPGTTFHPHADSEPVCASGERGRHRVSSLNPGRESRHCWSRTHWVLLRVPRTRVPNEEARAQLHAQATGWHLLQTHTSLRLPPPAPRRAGSARLPLTPLPPPPLSRAPGLPARGLLHHQPPGQAGSMGLLGRLGILANTLGNASTYATPPPQHTHTHTDKTPLGLTHATTSGWFGGD